MSIQEINSSITSHLLLSDLNDFKEEGQNWYIKSTNQKIFMKKPSSDNPKKIESLQHEFTALLKFSDILFQLPIGFYHKTNSNDFRLITLYAEYQSLLEFMKEENYFKLDIQKLIILTGIAFGMKYLHDKNIIHGHLCPSHVLIGENKEPIMFHFGIPRELDDENLNGEALQYLAPEIIFEGEYTKKSDVYAFGLIANQIYSEAELFSGLSKEEIIRIKTNEGVSVVPTVPQFLKDIIMRCLKKDESSRPSFDEILLTIRGNIFEVNDNISLFQYIKKMMDIEKQKVTYKIPYQIIKLPKNHNIEWSEKTANPINVDKFVKKIYPFNERKALIIMLIGRYQQGKSTFLKEVTGNLAYATGKGHQTKTLGIHLDGPYYKNDIMSKIYIAEFKEKFDSLKISDDTEIYFMDSQGIGEEQYYKFRLVLDRIYPIFTAISTICISVCSASDNESVQDVFKIIRKIRLMDVDKFTHTVLLVKDYDPFKRLKDHSFDIISDEVNKFPEEYAKSNENLKYYLSDYLSIIPLADNSSDYGFYQCSVWYALYRIFSLIDEENLLSKTSVINFLINLSVPLFSRDFYLMKQFVINKKKFKMIKKIKNEDKEKQEQNNKNDQQKNDGKNYDDNSILAIQEKNKQENEKEIREDLSDSSKIMPQENIKNNELNNNEFEEEEEIFEDIRFSSKQIKQMNSIDNYFSNAQKYAEILNYCIRTSYYIASNIANILAQSRLIGSDLEKLMNSLQLMIQMSTKLFLPFFIGNYNISVNDFYQYANEMQKDIKTFLKQNNKKWMEHMKNEKNSAYASIAIGFATLLADASLVIPVAGEIIVGLSYGIQAGFLLYVKIQKTIRNFIINDSFNTSLFPFIWNHQLKKVSGKQYDIVNSKKSIGNENEQLIIFFEQNEGNNDSTLIFRSLTGYDVNFKDQKTVSLLYQNVSIEDMIKRYNRGKKIHKSNLRKKDIKKVHVLYLKGYTNRQITEFCLYQNRKPILVSSIVGGQNVSINPGCEYEFNLFVISLHSYEFSTVNKDDYITNVIKANNIVREVAPNNKRINLLPIYSKDYNFNGPVANSLIKYGCRYVLQDTIFDAFKE